jgi:hypothetical protein
MDPFKSNSSHPSGSSPSAHSNPFARALAEVEKNRQSSSSGTSLDDLRNQAMHSNFDSDQFLNPNQKNDGLLTRPDQIGAQPSSNFPNLETTHQLEQQQKELKRQQMREKLHRMVNPVEQTAVFDAREEQRKKQINEVRVELKKLAEEISMFYKEIDITLTQNVVSTGQTGVYHHNFFAKLKEFIQMLRQRISSARTWARQAKMKNDKRRYRYGLDFTNQEAKSTHDMLHHERSNAFGS